MLLLGDRNVSHVQGQQVLFSPFRAPGSTWKFLVQSSLVLSAPIR